MPLDLAGVVALDGADPVDEVRRLAPEGVDRIVDGAFDRHADFNAAIAAPDAVIAAYATIDDRPSIPFWPLLFQNVSLRFLGGDDFPLAAKLAAVADLNAAVADGRLRVPWAAPLPLDRIAQAHDRVDAGSRQRVLLAVPQ